MIAPPGPNSLAFSLTELLNTRGGLAYLDPGTGSYALQMALAGFFAVVFAGRSLWRNLWQRSRRGRDDSGEDQ